MTLAPAQYDFGLVRGQTWSTKFVIYSNEDHTLLFPLDGVSVEITFDADPEPVVLTSDAGLIILDPATGTIQPFWTDTDLFAPGLYEVHWYMKLINSLGGKSYPVRGSCYVENP